jgi:prepilin-type N-terminal cleavage/methylation domain-containing protein
MKKAFTLIELLIVVLILSLLATIAVGVFNTQVERARYAAARTTIANLELAITRYQLDTGEFPPSGSSELPALPSSPTDFEGNGLMYVALTRSMSADARNPASRRWQGPYIDVKELNLGDLNGTPLYDDIISTPTIGMVQILDPWGSPYRYVRSTGSSDDNYTVNNATELPSTHPFASTDIYHNASTFQIVSNGRNGTTNNAPSIGLEEDDVNNF